MILKKTEIENDVFLLAKKYKQTSRWTTISSLLNSFYFVTFNAAT